MIEFIKPNIRWLSIFIYRRFPWNIILVKNLLWLIIQVREDEQKLMVNWINQN